MLKSRKSELETTHNTFRDCRVSLEGKGAAEVKKKSTTEGINAKLNIPEVFQNACVLTNDKQQTAI